MLSPRLARGRAHRPDLLFAGIQLLAASGVLQGADVFRLPPGLRSLELVAVGHPGNASDTNGFGAVGYS